MNKNKGNGIGVHFKSFGLVENRSDPFYSHSVPPQLRAIIDTRAYTRIYTHTLATCITTADLVLLDASIPPAALVVLDTACHADTSLRKHCDGRELKIRICFNLLKSK